ncbi:MAG TPA: C39 family peptidase [Candidatus Magasanikbacteria bacterium]|nr:C39 family peptidase [Candidatus Magasanikbacteria bacterium]
MKKIMLKSKPFKGTPFKCWCGPSSLKIVFDFYGLNVTESSLAKLCKTTREHGTSIENLEKTVKKFGFKFKIQDKSSFEDIKKWLEKGVPVIVDWFTRGRNDYADSEVADGHYSVVVGLDDKFIYINDPEIGRIRKIKKVDFMIVWFDFPGNVLDPKKVVLRRIIAIYK